MSVFRVILMTLVALSPLAGLPDVLAQPLLPAGGEFQVNTYTTNGQVAPAVATDAAGNFVVAWTSYGSSGSDPNVSIQARRYDATGAPLGAEFQVNTYTTGSQTNPAVAIDPAGNFVVAWTSYGSAGSDTSYGSIQARRYDATGAPALLRHTTTKFPTASVAMLSCSGPGSLDSFRS